MQACVDILNAKRIPVNGTSLDTAETLKEKISKETGLSPCFQTLHVLQNGATVEWKDDSSIYFGDLLKKKAVIYLSYKRGNSSSSYYINIVTETGRVLPVIPEGGKAATINDLKQQLSIILDLRAHSLFLRIVELSNRINRPLGELFNTLEDYGVISGSVLYVQIHPWSESWFHGKIVRDLAEEIMSSASEGQFLVKESVSFPGDYVLFVRDAGQVKHFKVSCHKNMMFTINGRNFFYTIAEMIQFYKRKEGLPIKGKLKEPVTRSEVSECTGGEGDLCFKRGVVSLGDLLDLAHDVGLQWKSLCRILLGAKEVEHIDHDQKTLNDKCYTMLDRWKKSQASYATYAALGMALMHEDLQAEELCAKYCLQFDKAPSEILSRGRQAAEAFQRALLEGKGYARRVPLMIIGQARTGKTSLKRSLKGELFNPDEGSTQGIETDPSYFKVSTDVWRTGKNSKETEPDPAFSFEYQAAKNVSKSLKKGIADSKAFKVIEMSQKLSDESRSYVTVPTNQDSKLVGKANAVSVEPTTEGMNSQGHNRAPKLPEDIAALVKRLLENSDEDEDDIYSIIWDFGGQSVYYDSHPIFLTKKAIYILAFDLSRDPFQRATTPTRRGMYGNVRDTCCSKTNFDYLDFWMSSVYSLVSHNTGDQESFLSKGLPVVFLVCTHADRPYHDCNPEDLASKIYSYLKKKIYGKLLKGFFVIDNTKSGSKDECRGVVELREKVLAVAKNLPQVNEPIPLKWLKYEKVLRLLNKKGYKRVSIETARKIAVEECGIDDDVQFRVLLNFLHDQRIVIYFSKSLELESQSMVILSPQWLIDVFKEVITVKNWRHVEENVEELWCKFEETGILEEELLHYAWRPLLDDQEACENLVAIMERFSLLCSWPSDGTTRQYLVPSMLISPPTEDVLKHLACVWTPPLFVAFKSDRVPPGLFPRLVLLFHQWSQEKWKSDICPELYKNFAMFHILPHFAISIVFILHSSSIEIIFHDGNDAPAQMAGLNYQRDLKTSRAIHLQLRCLLERIREEFFWLEHMRYEICVCCPVCSKKGTKCRAHDMRGCECLHLLSELELRERSCCTRPGICGNRTIDITTFKHWFALSDAQENRTPLIQHQDVTERDNNAECCKFYNEETASERSAWEPPEVTIYQVKNQDLPKRAVHLDDRQLPVDILLLTVEDCEFLSCLSYLNPDFCKYFHRDLGYMYLGDMGEDRRRLKIAVMNCCRGSSSSGGSVVVVLNAAKVLRPKAVFCVGSCSGLDCNKVNLGDIVVLEKLVTYGPCKITEGGIEERGVKVPLKSGLSKVILRAGDGWKPPLKDPKALEVKIHRGTFLSGPEEIDNCNRCKTLIERFPQAVAIEEEGEGVFTAAHDLDIEWIVIKGISDYAGGKKSKPTSWKPFSSLMAASLTAHILSDAIIFQDWPHCGRTTRRWVDETIIKVVVAGVVCLIAVVWLFCFGSL